jgi:diguanylate cyclase (GGDEF)-like protein
MPSRYLVDNRRRMELLLWRWSTAAQITSALMIAVFFSVLARSVRRIELRPWVNAWVVNLFAMLVTLIFWVAQPESTIAFVLLRWGYVFAKTMFVLLLVLGTMRFRKWRGIVATVGALSFAGAFLLNTIDKIGVTQSAVIGIALGAGAAYLLARHRAGSGWLAAGFALRALLAFVETAAYAMHLTNSAWSQHPAVGIFLASHSSFDTGAEWVIALGCVLTLYRRIQEELTDSNRELLAAKDVLQELVDRDSLTGLANRRALPAVLRDSFETGATIFFFDLNDFKDINDSYGHHTGDDVLRRFAHVLEASFRPHDHVMRYGGDEFVVVAPGVTPDELGERIESLRERVKFEQSGGPQIRFSVGESYLPPNGEPDAALRAADQAMYRDKAAKTVKMRVPR